MSFLVIEISVFQFFVCLSHKNRNDFLIRIYTRSCIEGFVIEFISLHMFVLNESVIQDNPYTILGSYFIHNRFSTNKHT